MMPVVLVIGIGSALLLGLLRRQRHQTQRLRSTLVAYELHVPSDLAPEEIARWLGMLAATHEVPRSAVRPTVPLFLEVHATATGIQHFVVLPAVASERLLSTIRAGLPGARLEAVPKHVDRIPPYRAAAEIGLTTIRRPLAIERGAAVGAAMLATLQPLHRGEEICLSWCLSGATTPHTLASGHTQHDLVSTLALRAPKPLDHDQLQARRRKEGEPLLWAALRIGVVAASHKRARVLLTKTTTALHGMNAPGVALRRRMVPARLVLKRLRMHSWPSTRWPLLLNASELSGLIGFPTGGITLPGLAGHASRQLPPIPGSTRSGLLLARSNYPGTDAPLVLHTVDRLRHLHLIGPTGTGKSTLIANMALQDIAAGRGMVVIDPKNDLVDDILARIPDARRDAVVVLDPAAIDTHVVGLNLLGGLHTEADRELVVDHVLHIMSSLWADSWGPRTSDVLRNALLTLTHTSAANGSKFTVAEVAELLSNGGFRRFVTSQPTVPDAVRSFWQWYEQQSDAQIAQVIGPSLNKLRALTTRTSLRLMLGQSGGVEIGALLRPGCILLVKLSKGLVGTETAHLLGALLMASLWHATLKRSAMPAGHRHPSFIYADEFQDVLRLPLDIGDMLAQARGLGVGLILAHQHLGQLPEPIKRAVLGTVRSSVVFQLDYDDAQTVARRLAPLSAADISGLGAYEVALRLSLHGQIGRPVTGTTLPLGAATMDAALLAEESRARFGMLRADIEVGLRARLTLPATTTPTGRSNFGRRKRGTTP